MSRWLSCMNTAVAAYSLMRSARSLKLTPPQTTLLDDLSPPVSLALALQWRESAPSPSNSNDHPKVGKARPWSETLAGNEPQGHNLVGTHPDAHLLSIYLDLLLVLF